MNDSYEKKASEEKEELLPDGRLERALFAVYKNKSLSEILHIISYVIVFLTAYAFLWRMLVLIENSPSEIIKLLIVTGVPFVTVSILRRFINAPRPYEILEFYENKPKNKSGRSFPSRHVFSVFVIGTVLLPWNPLTGIGLLAIGAVLAAIRVLLGIHFIRDVIAGALIGIVSGIIGILIVI